MITRFAPSPTGPLHLGHAFSAITAFDRAREAGGTFLLRLEDIDRSRARPEWEAQIAQDLAWLGLDWPEPVLRQSERLGAYSAAILALWNRGLVYPCRCSRRDITEALSAPQEGAAPPVSGPDGPVYPGTCRPPTHRPPPIGAPPDGLALRLDMARAAAEIAASASGHCYEERAGDAPGRRDIGPDDLATEVGDVVLARPGLGTSYHLAVVVDDAAQGVTEVVRGADLQAATRIHVVLQRLLRLPVPAYHHHRLIRDAAGKRLAKRSDAMALARYRAAGETPRDIRARLGLPTA